MPESVGASNAGGEELGVVMDGDLVAVELGCASGVAELPDGEKGAAAEGWEDVTEAGAAWKTWEWEQASVGGRQCAAVGKADLDGLGRWCDVGAWAVEHEVVAVGPCVDNGSVRVCRCGRGGPRLMSIRTVN